MTIDILRQDSSLEEKTAALAALWSQSHQVSLRLTSKFEFTLMMIMSSCYARLLHVK
jgi:hypothetical protein